LALAALCLSLGLASTPTCAQDVYKSRRPDGSVVYSDKPPADASKTETIDQSRVIIERSNSEERRRVSSGGKAAPKEADGKRSPAAIRADAAVKSAQDALAKAQKAQVDGAEPLPGERTGIVSKKGSTNTRLNDAYEDRQKELQDKVSAAQQTLDKAQQQRNAVKD
jgi:bifunctional DNA-binding transcriptional regulator/antitoxin component of YhaV-PrlF toxin-antitoxin module